MGHLTVKEYMGFFDQAEWHCFFWMGFQPRWISERHIGWADARHTVLYKREILAGDLVSVESRIVHVGTKSVTTLHQLFNAGDGTECATLEAVSVQYDLNLRCAIPLFPEVRRGALALLGDAD